MRQTAPFADQLDALGIWWPRGDGDAMRAAAQAWTAIADVVAEIADSLDDVQMSVAEGYRGPAADALRDLWAAWSGPDGHLLSTADDCRRLAAALTDFGGDVDAAHTTLVRLIEAVLEGGGGVSGSVDGDDIEYLRTGADDVGAVLSQRASVRGRPLGDIAAVSTRTPADRSAIDTSRVSWVDPGAPDDLTFLVEEPVDLGAGQGAVASLLPGILSPIDPIGWVDDGGNLLPTPCPGPGLSGGAPSGPPVACPTPEPPIDLPGALDDDAQHLDDEPLDASFVGAADTAKPITLEPPTGSGFGGGGGGGGGFSGGFDLASAFDALPDGAALGAVPLAAGAAAIPISVARPSASTPLPPVTSPAAVPASGSASGSRMPFMPMMPMSGGGGEDGTEPKRRRVRKPRWPEPQ